MLFQNLLVTFLSFYALTAHSLTIISDLDDTIKITRVKNLKAIKNSLLKTDTFLGMSELLRSFKTSDEQNKLFIVSGSFDLLDRPVASLLDENNIVSDGVFLVNGSSKKPEVLNQLIQNANDEIILLGDDQEHDPEFYQNLKLTYPDRIKAIYIHQLNEVILPAGQIGYFTAYEVAAHEHAAGRLQFGYLENVKNFILENLAYNTKQLIPKWQECSIRSVRRVLSTTRAFSFTDKHFLNLVEKVALKNCDD